MPALRALDTPSFFSLSIKIILLCPLYLNFNLSNITLCFEPSLTRIISIFGYD